MARTYNVRLIALALAVPIKWLDNLLSHHALPGVIGGRQGIERRIADDGILAIELARILASELGVPLSRAVALVQSAIANRDAIDVAVSVGSEVRVVFQIQGIERRLRRQLIEAMEAIGQIPRGRPRRVLT
jgi:hypothetical protein